ncbi:ribonuclease H-like protein [Schizophyllum commune H4-8]|nr:ribonuclease H-like protein [Schizophyllum commune H4-8]KAI5892371.1 ribonuclease H-like protein [Schizophyllum commune H4-8]
MYSIVHSSASEGVNARAGDNYGAYYDPCSSPYRSEGVVGRKMIFCEALTTHYALEDLIQVCEGCLQYSARCCTHNHEDRACHHYRLIFTDGACSGNGWEGSAAGDFILQMMSSIGVVLGQRGPGIDSFSLAITEAMDPGQRRTSQRAELLAAIEGVRRSAVGDVHPFYGNAPQARIIVSDSEYVVRGMTEWLPQWKRNGFRTAIGGTPANLDLFLLLDRKIEQSEAGNNFKFGFWHVPRHLNHEADRLAKAGAAAAREMMARGFA